MTDTKKEKTTLLQALFEVQKAAPSIDKSADNPFFKSKYADLPAIWQAIKPLLSDNGLLISHTMESTESGEIIRTKIYHVESGEFIESSSKITLSKTTAQEYGSYITYMRRYAVSAMLGLVTDEDDDGNNGNKASQPQKPKEEPKKPWEQIRANEIVAAIKKHTNPAALEKMWIANEEDLIKINEASERAYSALLEAYNLKLKDLDDIPQNFEKAKQQNLKELKKQEG